MSNILCGLNNRGNTCFLNTCIQLLINVDELTNYFLKNEYISDLNNNFKLNNLKKTKDVHLSYHYAELVKQMSSNNNKLIDPISFHKAIQKSDDFFSGFEQQDSQEVMLLILDLLNDGLNYEIEINYKGKIENDYDKLMVESIKAWDTILKNKYSIVSDLFYGLFINKIYENKNNKVLSKTFESFNMLTLSVMNNNLYSMLDIFFKNEKLDDEYLDEKTNKKCIVSREIKIMSAPKYLIIVLKKYTSSRQKMNDEIIFPLDELNLSKYCMGYDSFKCLYNLISVGCHVGNLQCGHYFSIVKKNDNNWYNCNDSDVSLFDIEKHKSILYRSSYILVYKKQLSI
mgnify:CR=1 FL=1